MTYTRRRLAAVGTLFLIASLVILSALPALAHTPSIQAKCDGLKVSLTFYNTRYDNSVVVTIDGVVVDSESDFGTTYTGSFPWDDTVSHSYLVVVAAWDDPNGEKGWSFSHQGSQQACRQVTTTTQQETTTTTHLKRRPLRLSLRRQPLRLSLRRQPPRLSLRRQPPRLCLRRQPPRLSRSRRLPLSLSGQLPLSLSRPPPPLLPPPSVSRLPGSWFRPPCPLRSPRRRCPLPGFRRPDWR